MNLNETNRKFIKVIARILDLSYQLSDSPEDYPLNYATKYLTAISNHNEALRSTARELVEIREIREIRDKRLRRNNNA